MGLAQQYGREVARHSCRKDGERHEAGSGARAACSGKGISVTAAVILKGLVDF
jgi:hypothetical protein